MKILVRFVEVYCRAHHQGKGQGKGDRPLLPTGPEGGSAQNGTAPFSRSRRPICAECRELLDYARSRLQRCPLDPKPKCKRCHIHCYKPEYRQRIKDVMKFSGMHFVKRGRLDWLVKYFLSG